MGTKALSLLHLFVMMMTSLAVDSTKPIIDNSPHLMKPNSCDKGFSKSAFEPFDIECILSDVDGTLTFGEHHSISSRTIKSIEDMLKLGMRFYPATGRTRSSMNSVTKGALTSIFGGISKTPGVYQQGLMVYGPDGNLIYERTIEPNVIEKVASFCDSYSISLLAYAGEHIYCKKRTAQTDRVLLYQDPLPAEFPSGLHQLLSLENVVVHKLILIDDDDNRLKELRPLLQEVVEGLASLTTAVSGMLEVLPLGASKGDGVRRLLEHLNVSPEKVVAFGDGENDVEMFQVVGHPIAVENARSRLKDSAKFITGKNSEDGVAEVLDVFYTLAMDAGYKPDNLD